MPNGATEKTRSGRSVKQRWAMRVFVVLAIAVGVGFLWWSMNSTDRQTVQLRGHTYSVTIMQTKEQLEKGLSGTDRLPAGHAMFFAFPGDEKWPIWMKDMKYAIDIVWTDNAGRVVYLVQNAEPSSYPNEFRPDTDTRYVIELPSGTIEKTGIHKGDQAVLPSGV